MPGVVTASPQVRNLTVAVCTYNRAESLADTLDSLANQHVPEGLVVELLVIDNNSSDHTAQLVERYADHPLNLRYLFEPKQGLSHARNKAIQEAVGDILLFTDDDVLPAPDWIEHTIEVFAGDAMAGVAGGKILPNWVDGSAPRWITEDLYPYLALLDYGDEPLELRDRPVWGANIAFRLEPLRALGGFDTAVGRTGSKLYAGEETALVNAIRDAGYKVWYQPASVVLHRMERERISRRYFVKWVWDNGELDAAAEPVTNGRRFLRVPIYHYRLFFRQLLSVLKADSNRRFHRTLLMVREASHIWHLARRGTR